MERGRRLLPAPKPFSIALFKKSVPFKDISSLITCHSVLLSSRRQNINLEEQYAPEEIMNITLESLLILLIVAGIAGAIGQWLAGYSRGGLITSIVLGFIGAFLGTWVAKQFHLAELYNLQVGRTTFPIVWAILGAALFVALLGLMNRRPAFRRRLFN
jgi:uncharacterized membrane protein YeaQ/YmgE (transglycosylase-associated protein family)